MRCLCFLCSLCFLDKKKMHHYSSSSCLVSSRLLLREISGGIVYDSRQSVNRLTLLPVSFRSTFLTQSISLVHWDLHLSCIWWSQRDIHFMSEESASLFPTEKTLHLISYFLFSEIASCIWCSNRFLRMLFTRDSTLQGEEDAGNSSAITFLKDHSVCLWSWLLESVVSLFL